MFVTARPVIGSKILVVFIGTVIGFTIISTAASIFFKVEFSLLKLITLISFATSFLIANYYLITIDKHHISIRGTKFGFPFRKKIPIREIRELTVIKRNIFMLDGMPQSIIYLRTNEGSLIFPLGVYKHSQIVALIEEALQANFISRKSVEFTG